MTCWRESSGPKVTRSVAASSGPMRAPPALGVLLALGIGRAFSSMLYQVSPVDPVAFALAAAVLVGTALFACWLPARRAMGVAPIVALRHE